MVQFGPDLFVGGVFTTAGGIPANFIARWDGTQWHSLPDERAVDPHTMVIHQGALIAGGHFESPSGNPFVTGVLRWTGQTWVVDGANPPGSDVYALTTYQGRLIAGGSFTVQNGLPQPGEFIAQFDGTNWIPVGTGLNARVQALTTFDPDGPGPLPELLIAGGSFNVAGGQPANGIAAWDGTQWMPLGTGVNGPVKALAVYNNQLAVGGFFDVAGGQPSPYFAVYGCPQPPPCYPNCDASTAPPVLNINDFSCFLNAFASASPYANCDGSTRTPALNILDFVCFLNRFAAGCS